MKLIKHLILASAIVLPTSSVLSRELALHAPGTNVSTFANGIASRLTGKTVGFAYVIAKNGRLAEQGQGGYARLPLVNSHAKTFTVNTDVNVYSVSKPITAIAVMQLIEKLGVHPNDPIADWLPSSWQKGYGFNNTGITFRELLTHRTGMQQTISSYINNLPGFADLSPNTWDGIKEIVENGIDASWSERTCATKQKDGTYLQGSPSNSGSSFGVYCYKNANYALARILIWQMALATGDIISNNELSAEMDSASGYQHYVRKNVLQPAGVDGFCTAGNQGDNVALAYDINQNLFPLMLTRGGSMGGSFPGGLLTCGPKNWWLSAMDLAAVTAHLHHGKLLSPISRQLMDEYEMGWSRSSNSNSRPNFYWHGGLGKWTRNNRLQYINPAHPFNPTNGWLTRTVSTNDRVQTCMMKLPDGLDATLVMNSGIRGSSASPCGVLLSAFDEAQ